MGCCSFITKPLENIGKTAGNIVGGFLGGGGSSSQSSSQNTNVDNSVEVNFDVDKLAKTMENNTLKDIFFKSELAAKELTIKEKEAKTKEDALRVSAMALQQQMKTDKNMMILTTIGIVLSFLGFIYTKKRSKKQ